MNLLKKWGAGVVLGMQWSLQVLAAPAVSSEPVLPSVNGVPISSAIYSQRLKAELALGQKDTPALRTAIIADLINRQLMISEANRRGLDKKPEVQQRLATFKEDLLIEWLFQENASARTVSDSEIRAEYDRQVNALGPIDQTKEYQLSLIMLPSLEAARRVVASLQKGEAFDELARVHSIDGSKSNGGKVGWVLPQALNPMVANVMVNLPKGTVTANPIETNAGWAVIRVDETRFYKAPTFDEARERILGGLVQNKRLEFIDNLRSKATIKP